MKAKMTNMKKAPEYTRRMILNDETRENIL